MHLLARIGTALASMLLPCYADAGAPDASYSAPLFRAADAVAPATLDRYRGGVALPSGMVVTLGIERVLSINGELGVPSTLAFGDLGRLTAGTGVITASGPALPLGTLIQNSLNNQSIQHTTIINASVDTHGALQVMHFQATLANALHLGLTGR